MVVEYRCARLSGRWRQLVTVSWSANLHCDYRAAGARCLGHSTRAVADNRQGLAERAAADAHGHGWTVAHGARAHRYDLCPVHAAELPGKTFDDWKNPFRPGTGKVT